MKTYLRTLMNTPYCTSVICHSSMMNMKIGQIRITPTNVRHHNWSMTVQACKMLTAHQRGCIHRKATHTAARRQAYIGTPHLRLGLRSNTSCTFLDLGLALDLSSKRLPLHLQLALKLIKGLTLNLKLVYRELSTVFCSDECDRSLGQYLSPKVTCYLELCIMSHVSGHYVANAG